MCSRYMLSQPDLDAISRRFDVAVLPKDPIQAEIDYRPTLLLPAVTVRREGSGERALEELRWGLIPAWAKDISAGTRAFNARAEGIDAKPTFRKAVREHRCLLPASAYFEWQNVDSLGGTSRAKLKKQPWRFTIGGSDADGSGNTHPEAGSELFAFAGLWDVWKNPATGEWVRSAAMITCAPNAVAEGIHNRMPVILPRAAEGVWLDPGTPLADALRLLTPYTGEMHAERWSFTRPDTLPGLE